MNRPGDATAAAVPGLPADAADYIASIWHAVDRNEMSWTDACELAARPALAKTASLDSVQRLIDLVTSTFSGPNDSALRLAGLAERHASAISEVGRHRDALRLYQALSPVYERHASADQIAEFLTNQAPVLGRCGLLTDALETLDRALPLLNANAEMKKVYHAGLLKKAATLLMLGRYDECITIADEVLPFLTEKTDPHQYIGCLQTRATALWQRGRLAEALAEFDKVLPLFREHAGLAHFANVLTNRAGLLREQGKLAEALVDYDAALPLLKQHAAATDHARCMMLRATLLAQQGEHTDALRSFDEALPSFKQHAAPAHYATFLGARAITLRALGKHEQAIADYDSALALLQLNAPPAHYAVYLMNRANALRDIGKDAEAIADYDHALPLLKRFGQPAEYTRCLGNRTYALHDAGRHAEAVEGFAQARSELRTARERGRVDDTSMQFTNYWTRLFRLAVDSALACNATDRALETVCDAKAMLFGDLQHRLAKPVPTEPSEVLSARDALTAWMRDRTPTERCLPDNPFAASRDLDQDTIAILETNRHVFAVERDDRTQRYLTAWGQHYHRYLTERADTAAGASPTCVEVQASLPEDWAIVDYWWTSNHESEYSWAGNDEFIALLLLKHETYVQRLPFPIAKLRLKLDRLRESLRSPRAAEPNLDALTDLYARLFKPLMSFLRDRGIRGLYLVPHDFLHGLPLHAAYNSKLSSYLCDEFSLAYLPSAALLPRLPKPDLTGDAFLVANPEAGTASTLPFSHWEGEQLRDRLKANSHRLFIGPNATLVNTKAWGNAGLVVFSCHGHADPHFAPRSHLRLADDLLLAHDVLYRWPAPKQGSVIVLNGCQTGVPDSRAINEGMGLMTAFLLRGAGVVLATQWNVADGCAAEMVLEFVDAMTNHQASPAEALRLARDRVRRLTESDILQRIDEVTDLFDDASLERARMNACRAWARARAGLLDEAAEAAAMAGPVLREAGLVAEHQAMLDLAEVTRRRVRVASSRLSYDSPVFWGAFQLVGRVV